MQCLAEGDLPEGSPYRLGDETTKLECQSIPCERMRGSIHADLLMGGLDTNYVGRSASALTV